MERTRVALRAAACGLALVVSGCHGTGPSGDQASPSSDVAAVEDQEQGAAPTPTDAVPPAAATAYAKCLTGAGVPATVIDDTRVVMSVPDGQPGQAQAGDSSLAEQTCREQVPEYHDPDFNER